MAVHPGHSPERCHPHPSDSNAMGQHLGTALQLSGVNSRRRKPKRCFLDRARFRKLHRFVHISHPVPHPTMCFVRVVRTGVSSRVPTRRDVRDIHGTYGRVGQYVGYHREQCIELLVGACYRVNGIVLSAES